VKVGTFVGQSSFHKSDYRNICNSWDEFALSNHEGRYSFAHIKFYLLVELFLIFSILDEKESSAYTIFIAC